MDDKLKKSTDTFKHIYNSAEHTSRYRSRVSDPQRNITKNNSSLENIEYTVLLQALKEAVRAGNTRKEQVLYRRLNSACLALENISSSSSLRDLIADAKEWNETVYHTYKKVGNITYKNTYYPWIFAKCLTHDDETLMPLVQDVNTLLTYLCDPTLENSQKIKLSAISKTKLADPSGAIGFEMIGYDPLSLVVDDPVSSGSGAGISEMNEVYCMALMRDCPIEILSDYSKGKQYALKDNQGNKIIDIDQICDLLNTQKSNFINYPYPVTRTNLFRSDLPGTLVGPYISQFLYMPIKFGAMSICQLYTSAPDVPESVTIRGWLDIQQGKPIMNKLPQSREAPIYNLRQLAEVVHQDPAYGMYFMACLCAHMSTKLSIETFVDLKTKQSQFVETGFPDLLSTLGAVCRGALRTAWFSKWQILMRIRPEVMAARVHKCEQYEDFCHDIGLEMYPKCKVGEITDAISKLNKKIIESAITNEMHDFSSEYEKFHQRHYRNCLLPLTYPEGSPTHPACPAGHATVAGASITLLKAWLNLHEWIGNKLKPISFVKAFGTPKIAREQMLNTASEHSPDNEYDPYQGSKCSKLSDYNEKDATEMTVIGELNKLASNMAIGRNIAGVHYRCDCSCGLKAGEDYAISYLADLCQNAYSEHLQPIRFTLQKFDNTIIFIQHDGIVQQSDIVLLN